MSPNIHPILAALSLPPRLNRSFNTMQVIVAVQTRDQVFPSGTSQPMYLYSCQAQDAAGVASGDPSQQKSASAEATFDLPVGTYVATVSCLGVSATSKPFTVVEIAPVGDTLQVPDVITVTVQAAPVVAPSVPPVGPAPVAGTPATP